MKLKTYINNKTTKIMQTIKEQCKQIKEALNNLNSTSDQKRTGNKNSQFIGNPIRWNNVHSEIKEHLTRDEYMAGFAHGLIGNNGHNGSIIKNADQYPRN